MSTILTTVITDDLTGEEGARTRSFSLGGVDYTIDLTEANHDKLAAAFAPFIANAERIRRPKPALRHHTPHPDLVRQWAKDHGIAIRDRGRIPKTVFQAYEAARGRTPA